VPLLSANIVLCEKAITEKDTNRINLVRVTDIISLASGNNVGYCDAVTFLTSTPYDLCSHVLSVKMCTFGGQPVVTAPDYDFTYGYKVNPAGPGGLRLVTNFTIDFRLIGPLETAYVVWAFVDGEAAAKTPLMLRRLG
jgi:hypothetical protein